jgi:nucleoside-diphosphate-sugar epimerase
MSFEVFIYSEREIRFLNSKTESYEAFLTQTVKDHDVLVIAWRELPLFGGLKREVLNYLRDSLQSTNRVIYLSSVAVYGQSLTQCDEYYVPLPINSYGESKYEIEKYLGDYLVCKLFILRLSNVFGDSRFNDLINKAILSSTNHQTLELHSPAKIERDFISVAMVVSCIGRLLTFAAPTGNSEIFNVSSGKSITLEKLHSLLEEALNEEIDVHDIQAPADTIILSRVSNIKFVGTFAHPMSDQIEDLRRYIRQRSSVL